MSCIFCLIKRNAKLFFKDKGMFFTALITPGILLILYATFLGNIYKDSFAVSFPKGLEDADKILDALVGGQLVSSILSVSCITVAFCSNILMVQDKANGRIKDFTISPIKPHMLSISYFCACFISTFIVCFVAGVLCLVYIGFVGWYMSVLDVVKLFFDIVILVLFGTALSYCIHYFLSTQGQISAVGAIVSAGYGFICGAYMPVSQFSEGLKNVVMFLPFAYGTSLVRNHSLNGVFNYMSEKLYPVEVINGIKKTVDCDIYVFDSHISELTMYLILIATAIFLLSIFVLLNFLSRKK